MLSRNSAPKRSTKPLPLTKQKPTKSFLSAVIKIQKWFRFITKRTLNRKRLAIDRMLSKQLPPQNINISTDTLYQEPIVEDDEFINTRISRIFTYLKTVEEDTKSSIQDDNRQNSVFDTLKSKINALKSQLTQKEELVTIMQSQLTAIKSNLSESQTQK